MMSANKEILAMVLQLIWSEGQVDKVDDYIAPTYTIYHDPGDPFDGQVLDIEGYKHRLQTSRGPFPDQKFETLEMIEEGDKVVVSWNGPGTHLGDFPGFPASGKVIKMTGMTIYSFTDGKVSGHWQMVDRLSVFQQLAAPS